MSEADPVSIFQTINFECGETIFCEGEWGDCSYIILSGKVRIHKALTNGSQTTIAELGADQFFGEMALVAPGERSATVTVLEDCSVIVLTQAQFQSRTGTLDPVIKMVFDIILLRFRNTLKQLKDDNWELSEPDDAIAEQTRKALDQIHFEAEIRQGIAKGQFRLHYQPIVCLRTGKLAGFEGLMRWDHPTRGMVPPSKFIPVAEACNIIPRMTRMAIKQACSDLNDISVTALGNIPGANTPFVTVNVSGRDLANRNFYPFVERCVQHYGVPNGALKLEVTESSLMDDIDEVSSRMGRLRKAGVRIAIDDFGTGYSSLGYLSKLPISTLKIDRSFVISMLESDQMRKVTSGILRLAEQLGIDVVAEGIEETAHAEHLASESCDFGQGYLYSKPLPVEDLSLLIRHWSPRISELLKQPQTAQVTH